MNRERATPEKRDFRIDASGAAWSSTDLEPKGKGRYVGNVEEPEKGWTAYMVELAFDGGKIGTYKFTTEVRVLPDTLPFPEK